MHPHVGNILLEVLDARPLIKVNHIPRPIVTSELPIQAPFYFGLFAAPEPFPWQLPALNVILVLTLRVKFREIALYLAIDPIVPCIATICLFGPHLSESHRPHQFVQNE